MDTKPTVGRILHVYMRSEDGSVVAGPLCARVVALRDLAVAIVDVPYRGSFISDCYDLPMVPKEPQQTTVYWDDCYLKMLIHWEWPPR